MVPNVSPANLAPPVATRKIKKRTNPFRSSRRNFDFETTTKSRLGSSIENKTSDKQQPSNWWGFIKSNRLSYWLFNTRQMRKAPTWFNEMNSLMKKAIPSKLRNIKVQLSLFGSPISRNWMRKERTLQRFLYLNSKTTTIKMANLKTSLLIVEPENQIQIQRITRQKKRRDTNWNICDSLFAIQSNAAAN